jgi:hypothetical protein
VLFGQEDEPVKVNNANYERSATKFKIENRTPVDTPRPAPGFTPARPSMERSETPYVVSYHFAGPGVRVRGSMSLEVCALGRLYHLVTLSNASWEGEGVTILDLRLPICDLGERGAGDLRPRRGAYGVPRERSRGSGLRRGLLWRTREEKGQECECESE